MAATSCGAIWRPKIVCRRNSSSAEPSPPDPSRQAANAGEGRVVDHRDQGPEAGTLLHLRVGEAQRTHGAAVECALEGDDPGPMGVIAGQLDRALHRFRAGVRQEDARLLPERRDRREALHELEVARLVEVSRGDVDEPVGLLLDGGHDLGMRVAGRADGDAGREVEEAVAVDIGHDGAGPGLGDQRIGTRQRGAGDGLVALDDLASLRTGQLGDDVRRRQVAGSRIRGGGLHGGHVGALRERSGASCPRPWLDADHATSPIRRRLHLPSPMRPGPA
jgi:hypothetical protein